MKRCWSLLLVAALVTRSEALSESDSRRGQRRRQRESDTPASDPVDPEAALRYGYHVLRSHADGRENALAQFDTLTSGSGFPTGETLFLLGRAHDEGREDIGIKRDGAAARDLYERAAKLGHPKAQHALSVLLATNAEAGEEVEAILYDFFASLGGDPLAHAALGYRYLYGIGTVQNCAQSLRHYQVAARETIADLYSKGRGGIPRPVDRSRLAERFVAGRRPRADSDSELVDFWEVAAETGDLAAIRTMGVLYQHGARGVEQDLAKAFDMFDRGVNMLDHHSTASAANLLMRGAGTSTDYTTAHKFFKMTKSSLVSMNGMGYLHYHGHAVKQDIIQAFDYFEKARREDKENSNADPHFNLGLIFLSDQLVNDVGDEVQVSGPNEDGDVITLRRNPGLALEHLKNAASMGHVEAAFRAALLYAEDESFTIDKCKAAVSLMKTVVERGPWMEAMGEGLRRATAGDFAGALILYSRLAEIGVEVAQSNAAWLLDSGHCISASVNATDIGCEKRALRLYQHAAMQGRSSAETKVGDFHYRGKAGLPVDYEKAARRYQKAADRKDAEALFNMGYLHQVGKGLPQDLFLAKRYFDEAAEASKDAVPVVRLSLFSLRMQTRWNAWREWWRTLEAQADGESQSYLSYSINAAFANIETLALVLLAGLFAVVTWERTRRQRARRQERGAR